MGIFTAPRQFIVTAILGLVGYSLPLHADSSATELLESLKSAPEIEAKRLDRSLKSVWSRSGSASMDLLLRRGEQALEDKDIPAAIEHFTALTDHAPEFAEGWHGLARAYFGADMYGPTIDALEHALALNPDQYDVIYGLGTLMVELGDAPRAAVAFRQVLALHPHHQEAKEALKRLERLGIGRAL